MILHVAKKELREHAVALVVLAGLELLQLALAALAAAGERVISVLTLLRVCLQLFAPLAAVVLCQATFAKELRARTILFLEALPTSRARVFAAKLLVSLGAFLALVALAFVVVVSLAAEKEAIDRAFVLVLLARTVAWSLAVYGVAFLGALLGRFRVPLYLSLFLAASMYAYGGGDPAKLGPLALVSAAFESERSWPAWSALASGLGVFAAALVAGVALLFSREGSVAVLLGERMTHREKVIVAVVLLSATLITNLALEARTKEPYALTGASVIARDGPRASLSIQPGELDAGPTRRAADRLHAELTRLAEGLEIEHLAPVFLVHRADLDEGRAELGELAKREGVLVRANLRGLAAEALAPARTAELDLQALLARELLDAHTEGRSWLEGRAWVRDGYSELWTEHGAHAAGDEQRRALLTLRALYAIDQGFGFDDLARWHRTRDRLSEPLATALAWSVLDVLERARGDLVVRRFTAEVVGRRGPKSVLALARTWAAPALELLPERAGLDVAELRRLWTAWAEAERAQAATRLAALPHARVGFDVVADSALSRGVGYRAELDGAAARVSILFDELWGLDEPVVRQKLAREDLSADLARAGRLPRTWAPGARLYLALALWVPELGCEVLVGAERRTLE